MAQRIAWLNGSLARNSLKFEQDEAVIRVPYVAEPGEARGDPPYFPEEAWVVNFVEGVLKVCGEEAPICVVAVAKHPPSDGVDDGLRAFACSDPQ